MSIFKKLKRAVKPPLTYTTPEMRYYAQDKEILQNGHLLIAGATGSGKSVLLNNIIYALLVTHTPNTSILLIDPKRVELSQYKKAPHCRGYGQTMGEALQILDFAINQIENRYIEMEQQCLKEYPKNPIYIIIDELADLMLTNKKQILPRMQKILQIGRASKVYLIACTQAPSRKIIPAELTLNFMQKIALRCDSPIESRQIIGTAGAEALPKYGRAYWKKPAELSLITITPIEEERIQQVIEYWR